MNGSTNGNLIKKCVVTLAISITLFLGGMVLSNSTRITALEVKIDNLADSFNLYRTESREENREIIKKLDEVKDQVRNK